MNTSLHFSQNCKVEGDFLTHERTSTNAIFGLKTFAELSHRSRAAEVNRWLYETTEDNIFAGKVSFNSQTNDTSIDDIELAITVCENAHWKIAVTNDNKTAAFSTVLVPTKRINRLGTLNDDELAHLANILAIISTRYDNLMMASVGLSIEWLSCSYQADSLYAVVSPIVNNAPDMFGSQRFIVSDFTPEQTARRLSNLSDIHFRDIFPE